MGSDSSLQAAMEDILDGHTHRAAYSRLQKSGASPAEAVKAVIEAGRRAPLMPISTSGQRRGLQPLGMLRLLWPSSPGQRVSRAEDAMAKAWRPLLG